MQNVASNVKKTETVTEIEDNIATVGELFRLQGSDELLDAEKKYFGGTSSNCRAIILAASRGENFESLTKNSPKAMLPINGKPLLARTLERLKKADINDIVVVGGYASEKIKLPNIRLLKNPRFENSGELSSLLIAEKEFTDDMVILYGDIIFRGYILKGLIDSNREITVVVDSSKIQSNDSNPADYAYCSERDNRELWGQDIELSKIISSKQSLAEKSCGQWIGMIGIKKQGKEWIEEAVEQLSAEPDFQDYSLIDLLNRVIANGHQIRVIYIHGHWLNVNSLNDLGKVGDFSSCDS